jgi:hypothetical protein
VRRQKKLRRKPYHRRRWRSRLGFRGMTLRDWLPIVIAAFIPILIAFGTWRITMGQGKLEDQRAQQAQKIENQRAEAERELAEQRAQDEALQAYLDQMSTLLLEKDLRESEEGSEVRTLARARTLTVLRRLDPARKTEIIQFLVEAELVQIVDKTAPIISLSGADLSDADLDKAYLFGADLTDANVTPEQLDQAFREEGR